MLAYPTPASPGVHGWMPPSLSAIGCSCWRRQASKREACSTAASCISFLTTSRSPGTCMVRVSRLGEREGMCHCLRWSAARASIQARPPRHLLKSCVSPHCRPLHDPVFRVDAFDLEPAPSDEMEPIWVHPGSVPFEKMWADDIHWWVLAARRVSQACRRRGCATTKGATSS